MSNDIRKAAEQALETLERQQYSVNTMHLSIIDARDALRVALASEQPQPSHYGSIAERAAEGRDAGMWAEQPQPEAAAWPKVHGTARMFDNARALLVIMEREPTDDELRAFDDAIKGYAAPPPSAQPEAPSGWRMVPVEPTAKMLDAACELDAREAALAEMVAEYKRAGLTYSSGVVPMGRELTVQYRAMIAAAPTPPAEAVTRSNAALQAFQRFADYDAKTDCYVVQADDLRPAITAALAARGTRRD